ncbi:protein farnesyltransferase subunit beta [Tanacetum coccineum]
MFVLIDFLGSRNRGGQEQLSCCEETEKRLEERKLDPHVEEQFFGGCLYAAKSSRPGQCGCADGWPCLCYWILHSIALLGECVDVDLEHNAIDFLSRCQDEHGGHGGGPWQASKVWS